MTRQEIENYIAIHGNGRQVVDTLKEMTAEGISIATITEAQLTERLNRKMLSELDATSYTQPEMKINGQPVQGTGQSIGTDKSSALTNINNNQSNRKAKNKSKKPIYKKWWFWVIIILLFGTFGSNVSPSKDNNTTSDKSKVVEEKADEVQEDTKEVADEKNPLTIATEKGQQYFASLDWNTVFPYGVKIHYIMDYNCTPVPEELADLGEYVAYSTAEITNGFGATYNSTIYLCMDEAGELTYAFYEEPDGSTSEIPIE